MKPDFLLRLPLVCHFGTIPLATLEPSTGQACPELISQAIPSYFTLLSIGAIRMRSATTRQPSCFYLVIANLRIK
jgi:hypothetical protein